MFVSLFNLLLIVLSSFLRIVITFDTYQKEEKFLVMYEAAKEKASGHEAELPSEQQTEMYDGDFHSFVRSQRDHKDALIMFKDDQGSHPNLHVIGYFMLLVAVMALQNMTTDSPCFSCK